MEKVQRASEQKNGRSSLSLRINSVDDSRMKGVIVFSVLVIAVIVMLFFRIFDYVNPRIGISYGIIGVRILWMLLSGQYMIEGADFGEYGQMDIAVPVFPVAAFSVMILLLLAIAGVTLWFGIIKKRDYRFLGIPMMAYGALMLGLFLLLILAKWIPSGSADPRFEYFYQTFEVKKSTLLTLVLLLLAGGIQLGLNPKLIRKVKKFWFIYAILVVPSVFMLVFSFYPIFLQFIIAFKDYKTGTGIWGSEWVGFQYFQELFSDPELFRVVGNSIYLSLWRIFCSMVPPLILAIFLFDMGHDKLRKGIQTIVYIPHFFSWVIIYAIYYAFASNGGLIDGLVRVFTGDPNYVGNIMTNKNAIIPVLMITLVWKEIGWGTIIYLAALSNVDPTLYEAAVMDGAGPIHKLFNITLPSIASVIVFMLIMAIGSIISNPLDQILLFSNTVVMDRVYVIEYWVYKNGIGDTQYGLAAAVGFVQSLIGMTMVLVCNKISVKVTGRGVW